MLKQERLNMSFINQIEPWIDENEINHMTEYLKSGGWLTEFKKTTEFERMIAEYTGSHFCCVVANGTVSLAIALWAAGIGPGDEVLVPNYTMIATPNAVRLVGATPVLVDIESQTLCMDIDCVQKALTENTKAICLVSLNGRAPDMVEYCEFCRQHNLFFLEDAAQSLGSFQNNRHIGTFGDIGSFSFSSPKIITTGQGGALITDNEDLYNKIRKIKDFGREKGGSDWHDMMGYNFKFTDIQAVIGIEQMKKLSWRVQRKKEIYKLYASELHEIESIEMIPTSDETAPWFVDIYVKNPSELAGFLKENNIGSRQVYPPINRQKIYSDTRRYPVSESYCNRGLWLPSSSFLTDEQIIHICDTIKCFFYKNKYENEILHNIQL
jgi:perosamine synthetase